MAWAMPELMAHIKILSPHAELPRFPTFASRRSTLRLTRVSRRTVECSMVASSRHGMENEIKCYKSPTLFRLVHFLVRLVAVPVWSEDLMAVPVLRHMPSSKRPMKYCRHTAFGPRQQDLEIVGTRGEQISDASPGRRTPHPEPTMQLGCR